MSRIYEFSNASALILISMISGMALLSTANAQAQSDGSSSNDLKIQESIVSGLEQPAFEFAVQIEKTQFETGEPVSFRVEGTEAFYLYVFSEDKDTGEKTMLLPNAKQTYNAFPANSQFTVPDATVTFTRDTPGIELITAVATTEFVAIDLNELRVKEDFFEGDKELLDYSASAKGIVINGVNDSNDAVSTIQVYQSELTFIAAKPPVSSVLPDAEDSPAVMVTTSCAVCAAGKPMKIGFAADQDGVLTLILVEPDGEQSTLLNEKIIANEIQYVSAVAQAPLGDHALIAFFGAQDDEVKNAIANVFPVSRLPLKKENSDVASAKGLVLVEEPQALLPYAIRQFVVVE